MGFECSWRRCKGNTNYVFERIYVFYELRRCYKDYELHFDKLSAAQIFTDIRILCAQIGGFRLFIKALQGEYELRI